MSYRLSLSMLEQARQNPANFRTLMRAGELGWRGSGPSRYQILTYAALHFHKSGSLPEAVQHLARLYGRFKSPVIKKEYPVYEAQLRTYVREFQKRDVTRVRIRRRLLIDLPPQCTGQLVCSSQIPRAELNKSDFTYSLWLFSKDSSFSRNELRLPILQSRFSQEMQADLDEVSVGYFDFSSGQYTSFRYSEQEVETAEQEFEQIVTQLI